MQNGLSPDEEDEEDKCMRESLWTALREMPTHY